MRINGGKSILYLCLLATLAACAPRPAAAEATPTPSPPPSESATATPTEITATETSTPTLLPDFPEPAISEIGDQRILFSSVMYGNHEVFAINLDGTDLLQVTNNPQTEQYCPAWSPDGSQFAYTTHTPGPDYQARNRIVISDITGTVQGTYDAPPWNDFIFCPIWSPDGSRILVRHVVGAIVITPTGEELFKTSTSWVFDMEWSPDGNKIALSTYSMNIIERDGSLSELTEEQWTDQFHTRISWSPDSRKLAYYDIEGEIVEGRYVPGPVFILVSDLAGNQIQISPVGSQLSFGMPVWVSASHVAYLGVDPEGRRSIYGSNADGSNFIEYTPDLTYDAFAFAPSHSQLALLRGNQLYVLDFIKNELYQVGSLESVFEQPPVILWSPDESYLLLIDGYATWSVNLATNQVIDLKVNLQFTTPDIK